MVDDSNHGHCRTVEKVDPFGHSEAPKIFQTKFSLAMASQPLQSKDENWWEIFAYGLQYQKIFQHHSVLLEDYCLNSVFDI